MAKRNAPIKPAPSDIQPLVSSPRASAMVNEIDPQTSAVIQAQTSAAPIPGNTSEQGRDAKNQHSLTSDRKNKKNIRPHISDPIQSTLKHVGHIGTKDRFFNDESQRRVYEQAHTSGVSVPTNTPKTASNAKKPGCLPFCRRSKKNNGREVSASVPANTPKIENNSKKPGCLPFCRRSKKHNRREVSAPNPSTLPHVAHSGTEDNSHNKDCQKQSSEQVSSSLSTSTEGKLFVPKLVNTDDSLQNLLAKSGASVRDTNNQGQQQMTSGAPKIPPRTYPTTGRSIAGQAPHQGISASIQDTLNHVGHIGTKDSFFNDDSQKQLFEGVLSNLGISAEDKLYVREIINTDGGLQKLLAKPEVSVRDTNNQGQQPMTGGAPEIPPRDYPTTGRSIAGQATHRDIPATLSIHNQSNTNRSQPLQGKFKNDSDSRDGE
ncbi:unnamed protein product [Adineta steineri]|uniref:Uncharacterized protein n=2 Tax=Adineta steineri TaxID=433720 RepID=A0A813TQB8_9BILA|nr:unnamed protein product [Adineta steineri]